MRDRTIRTCMHRILPRTFFSKKKGGKKVKKKQRERARNLHLQGLQKHVGNEHFRVESRIVPAKCMVFSRLKTSTMVTFFKILQQQWTGISSGKRTQCSFMSAAQCSSIALEGHSNLEDRSSSPQVSGTRCKDTDANFFLRNGETCIARNWFKVNPS